MTTRKTPFTLRYIPSLDGIRGIAICLVFVTHYYPEFIFGRLGVSVFFVLSGFLITSVLLRLRKQSDKWQEFYKRRARRILPAYFAFWALIIICSPILHVSWNRGAFLNIVLLGNYIWPIWGASKALPLDYIHLPIFPFWMNGKSHILTGHFWTLCVEEQIYLFWPLLIFRLRSLRTMIFACVVLITGVLMLRFAIGFSSTLLQLQAAAHLPIFRIDEFAVGAYLSLIMSEEPQAPSLKLNNYWIFCALSACVFGCFWEASATSNLNRERIDLLFTTPAVDILSAIAIMYCVHSRGLLAKFLAFSPLRILGGMSYSFYIWHDTYRMLITDFVSKYGFNVGETLGRTLIAVLGFSTTLFVAWLSTRFIERNFSNRPRKVTNLSTN